MKSPDQVVEALQNLLEVLKNIDTSGNSLQHVNRLGAAEVAAEAALKDFLAESPSAENV